MSPRYYSLFELEERTKHFSMNEFRALRDLMLLYNEGAVEDIAPSPAPPLGTLPAPSTVTTASCPTRHFRLRSRRFPDLMTCPAIWAFLHATIRDPKQQHWHEIPSNLNTSQTKTLKSLQKCSEFVIKQSKIGRNIVLMIHTQYQCA